MGKEHLCFHHPQTKILFPSVMKLGRKLGGVGWGEGGGKLGSGEYQWFCHGRNLRFSLDVTVSVSPNVVYTHHDFKITIILDLPLELVF